MIEISVQNAPQTTLIEEEHVVETITTGSSLEHYGGSPESSCIIVLVSIKSRINRWSLSMPRNNNPVATSKATEPAIWVTTMKLRALERSFPELTALRAFLNGAPCANEYVGLKRDSGFIRLLLMEPWALPASRGPEMRRTYPALPNTLAQ